jgi:hypothetical protein
MAEMTWVEMRKRSRMTQWVLSSYSGVSRVKISLAETRQVTLTEAEEAAVHKAVSDYVRARSQELAQLASSATA